MHPITCGYDQTINVNKTSFCMNANSLPLRIREDVSHIKPKFRKYVSRCQDCGLNHPKSNPMVNG
jgi:hypothetical protein